LNKKIRIFQLQRSLKYPSSIHHSGPAFQIE